MPLFVPPLKIALRKRIGASAHLLLQKMTSAQGGATNGQKETSASAKSAHSTWSGQVPSVRISAHFSGQWNGGVC